jgi:hypothetical protein
MKVSQILDRKCKRYCILIGMIQTHHPISLPKSPGAKEAYLEKIRQFLQTPYQISPTMTTVQKLLNWKFTVCDFQFYRCTKDLVALRIYLLLSTHDYTQLKYWDVNKACDDLNKYQVISIGKYCQNLNRGIHHGLSKEFKERSLQNAAVEVLTHPTEIGLTPQQRVRFSLMVLKGCKDSYLVKLAFHELYQKELATSIHPQELLDAIYYMKMPITFDSLFCHPFLKCHELPMGDKREEYRDLLLQSLPIEDIHELIAVLPILDIPEENALALQNEPERREQCRKQNRSRRSIYNGPYASLLNF